MTCKFNQYSITAWK